VPDGANDRAVSTMDVERKRADWPHWPDRSNGPARRDRLERRLIRDSERESEVERAQLAIQQIGLAAAAKAAEVQLLERAVSAAATTHLVFAPAPGGYALEALEGEVPGRGDRIVVAGRECIVAKLGPSPLPGDDRRCAYLEPA
jgi:hypothetical protein